MKSIPEPIKQKLRPIKNFLRHLPYLGTGRFCPVCEKSSRKFKRSQKTLKKDVRCSYCHALERHRLTWLYFQRMTDLFDGRPKQMLHVAPELSFEKLLKKHLGPGYLTADLLNSRAKIKMDITNIQYADENFDVIYCSHVLEHVSNDKLAMREFYRVLKKNGWAVLLVPITTDKTFEDSSITDPEERLKFFGQEDHVRRYGSDYVERLRDAGFKVKVTYPSDFLRKDEIDLMGITKAAEEIYSCTKI